MLTITMLDCRSLAGDVYNVLSLIFQNGFPIYTVGNVTRFNNSIEQNNVLF